MDNLKLTRSQIEYLKKLLPSYHLFNTKHVDINFTKGQDKRMAQGNGTEVLYHAVLAHRFGENRLEFDSEKAVRQMFNGADGIPDRGFDIKIKGILYDYRIDCKYQECLADGTVNMGLFYQSGSEHFALNGKATHTAHFYLAYKPASKVLKHLLEKSGKPKPVEYTLTIVIVDLAEFRKAVTVENGKYSAGSHTEYVSWASGQRLLNVTVEWLVNNGCAISYKITA